MLSDIINFDDYEAGLVYFWFELSFQHTPEEIARSSLCSISVLLLIILIIAFSFSAQLTLVSAVLSISLKYAKVRSNLSSVYMMENRITQ